MVPIAITQNGNFDEAGFRKYLLELCQEHREKGRALAFAFLAYDFDNHTVQQIIDSKVYWTALDSISGHYLSIFYINTQDSYFKKRQREIYNEEIRAQRRAAKNGYIQLMRPITLKSTPLDKSVDFLKKELSLDESLRTPFILFFQIDGDDIIDSLVISLKEEKLEEAFLELKRNIGAAVEAVSRVTADNFGNRQEIFDLIKSEINSTALFHFAKTEVASKIGIGTIISLIRLLGGGM